MTRTRIARQRHPAIPGAAVACLALVCVALGVPAAHAAGAGKTVKAPGGGPHATVTVSRTTGLVNQSIKVSWTGFTPSSANVLSNGGGSFDQDTLNPVRVYECRGAKPTTSSDCYGAPGFAGVPAVHTDNGDYPEVPPVPGYTYKGQTSQYENQPDGPANFQDTVTGSNGKGSVIIQVFTALESPTLGCTPAKPCSVVVVPNYGRDAGPGAATENNLDAPWAWAHRTVVPLSFAPVAATCSLSKTPLKVEGSPIDARLLASWQVGTCNSSKDRVDVNYTSIAEPSSRGDFTSGASDVGLTTLPLTTTPKTKPVYAPISLSSLVVAFQVDDANGHPITAMKLNARLVAKIITASYRVADDSDVSSSAPFNLFHDPEFLKLNPGVQWPDGTPGNHPILLGDQSDLTWTLTRWINSDPTARAFLNGKPDPWGMTVNAAYKKIALPVQSFPSLDPNQANAFLPIQGLDQVARQLSIAQFPGGTTDVENGVTVVTKYPRQNPGGHEVIGIVDAADAADFLTHTASLQNSAGSFVLPTNGSVLAAAKHMTLDPNGVTRSVDLGVKDRSAYPLSVLTSAIVPTTVGPLKTTAITHFLNYASAAGQVPGTTLGQLPAGYVPLPASLTALDTKAVTAVTSKGPSKSTHHHKGARGGNGNGNGSGSNNSGGTPATPSPQVTVPPTNPAPKGPSVASGPLSGTPAAPIIATVLSAVRSATSGRSTLPLLLVLGLLAFLAGPLVLFGRRPTWRKLWPLH